METAMTPDTVSISYARKLDTLEKSGIGRAVTVIIDNPLILNETAITIDEANSKGMR